MNSFTSSINNAPFPVQAIMVITLLMVGYKTHRFARRKNTAAIHPVLSLGMILIFGVFFFYRATDGLYVEKLESNWKPMNATILSVAIDHQYQSHRGRLFFANTLPRAYIYWYPVWDYSYTVNGQNYIAEPYRSNDFPHTFDQESAAQSLANSRPNRSKTMGYYDPEHPQHSVLEKYSAGAKELRFLVISLLLLALGVYKTINFNTALENYKIDQKHRNNL